MSLTKAERKAAGKKAAKTRMRNEILAEMKKEDLHGVETPEEQRTTEQEVSDEQGFDFPNPDSNWERPSELQAPKPRPGFTQRWIRIKLGNESDARNSQRKFREGWVPRGVDTVPEGYAPPTFLHPQLGNLIGVEDLILCEMPITKAQQRNAYYRNRRDKMIEGIENDLQNIARGGPRINQTGKTEVTKHRLRVPEDPTE